MTPFALAQMTLDVPCGRVPWEVVQDGAADLPTPMKYLDWLQHVGVLDRLASCMLWARRYVKHNRKLEAWFKRVGNPAGTGCTIYHDLCLAYGLLPVLCTVAKLMPVTRTWPRNNEFGHALCKPNAKLVIAALQESFAWREAGYGTQDMVDFFSDSEDTEMLLGYTTELAGLRIGVRRALLGTSSSLGALQQHHGSSCYMALGFSPPASHKVEFRGWQSGRPVYVET